MNQNDPGEKKLIAICGGIGAGKSTVSGILRKMGFEVIDCDKLARDVAELPEVVEKIEALFGKGVITEGKINRRALRGVAFSSADNIRKLNEVFFEKVHALILSEVEKAFGKTVFAEVTAPAALKMYPQSFSEVWEVCASEATRVRRVVFRDNVSEKTAREIMSRQEIPHELIVKTIINDEGIDELKAQISEYVRYL